MFRKSYASSLFRFLASSIWIPQLVLAFLTPTIRTTILPGTIRQLRTVTSFSSWYTTWFGTNFTVLFFMTAIFTLFSFGLISGSNSTQSSCQTHFSLQENHMLESMCPLLLPRLLKVIFDCLHIYVNRELSIMLINHPNEIYICFKVLKRM